MSVPGNTTIDEVKEWLRERIDDGVECPCCTQFCKVYRRRLSSHTARILIGMWRAGGQGWVHLPSLGLGHADEAKARYWGLIEPQPGLRDDGSPRTGWWRLTPTGAAFVRGQGKIAKYAYVYDGRVLEMDNSEWVTIEDLLGTKFDYSELMAGR